MSDLSEGHVNYQRIAKAIRFLVDNHQSQPKLNELSAYVGVSEFHLQRIFSEWAGVSPKQFLQYLTKENAKQKLKENSVMESALSCGLSGSGRLHDLLLTYESVTPGEYRNSGVGLEIYYGIHSSPFGFCFIATTHRGVCKLTFFDDNADGANFIAELRSEWSSALITEDVDATSLVFNQIFGNEGGTEKGLRMLLKGSPFQVKVWEALLKIPHGQVCSYQQIADSIGKSSAVRAVATAVARNNIAYLIPCHRVIRSTGALNNYRWGSIRKSALIGRESSAIVCNALAKPKEQA